MKKNMTKNDKKQGAEAYLRPQDTSLAVRQFVALARGDVGVHVVGNALEVVEVAADRRYCLRCYGVRMHDLVVVRHGAARFVALTWCRRCGEAVE